MSKTISAQLSDARRAIRTDVRRRGQLRALCMGFLAVIVALSIAHHGAVWAWITCIVLGLATVIYGALPWWRMRDVLRDPIVLARWVEARRPAFRNDLSASLEFDAREVAGDDVMALRTQLRERVGRQLQSTAGQWQDILPHRPLRAERWACAAMVLAGLAVMFTPAFRADDAADNADGTREHLQTQMLIGALNVEIQPPAYTRLPDQQIHNVLGAFTVPEGSVVTLSGWVLRPVQAGWIEGETPDDRVPITLGNGGKFQVQLMIDAARDVQLGFAIGGKDVRDQHVFHIQTLADKAPEITLYSPKGDVKVTPGEVIDLHYDVRDDYGIRDATLVYYYKGRSQDAKRLPLLGSDAGTFAEDTAPLDTGPLYMQPGDQVTVYIEARDNVSFRPPNVGKSRAVTLFVQEKHNDLDDLLALQENLFEALLKQLGSLLPVGLHKIVPDSKKGYVVKPKTQLSDADNATALDALTQSVGTDWPAVDNSLSAITAKLGEMEDADAREVRLFSTMAETLGGEHKQVARQLDDLSTQTQAGAVPSDAMRDIWSSSAQFTHDVERATLVVEQLISDHKAEDVARALEELSDIREHLSALLETYQKTNDPDVRARIERELDRLSRRMNELMQKLAAQVQKLPQQHFNAQALDRTDTEEQIDTMRSAMQQLRDSLSAGSADDAMKAFEQLSQNLDELYQNFGDPSLNANSQTLSEFDKAMGEVANSMSAVEQMQQAIADETTKMNRELREQKLKKYKDDLQRELEKAIETVKAAHKRAKDAKNPTGDAAVKQAEQDAVTSLQNLQMRLQQRDLSVAEDAALDAMDTLQRLQSEVSHKRRFVTDKDKAHALRDIEKTSRNDAGRMRTIAEHLNQWQQRLKPEPGKERAQQLQSLQKRQASTSKKLGELKDKMGEVQKQFPMMKPEDQSDMKQASKGMQQSEKSLQGHQSLRAQDGQQQALESLRSMRDGMKKRMGQRRKAIQRQAKRSGRGQGQHSRVDVTRQNERDLSERHKIMDAMREGSLKAWKDPIKQYYESLVR